MSTDIARSPVILGSGTSSESDQPSVGWGFGGLRVIDLAPGLAVTWSLDCEEGALIPLKGGCALSITTGGGTIEASLAGRENAFAGPTDIAYLPLGSLVTVTAPAAWAGGIRLALATALATKERTFRIVRAGDVSVGSHGCSHAPGADLGVPHVLFCEVVAPGGGWISYPPHASTGHDSMLEGMYYFEVAGGEPDPAATSPGTGHGGGVFPGDGLGDGDGDGDGSPAVRHGVAEPREPHRPRAEPRGYDLYYLNVTAGPAPHGSWLSAGEPDGHWIREIWSSQTCDCPLPMGWVPRDERRSA